MVVYNTANTRKPNFEIGRVVFWDIKRAIWEPIVSYCLTQGWNRQVSAKRTVAFIFNTYHLELGVILQSFELRWWLLSIHLV